MEHIKVYKWYSDNRVELVFEGDYNGEWKDIMDYIKENIPVRKVGKFIVYLELPRGWEMVRVYEDAEFEISKEKLILWGECLDAIRTVLCGEKR